MDFRNSTTEGSGTITADLLENEVVEVGISKGKYLPVNIYTCSQRHHRRTKTRCRGELDAFGGYEG